LSFLRLHGGLGSRRVIEIQFPPVDLTTLLLRNAQRLILFNLPAGDWLAGDRGLAREPGRELEFRAGVAQTVGWVSETGMGMVSCLAGGAPHGLFSRRPGVAAGSSAEQVELIRGIAERMGL